MQFEYVHIKSINAPCDLLDDRSTLVHATRLQTIAWTNADLNHECSFAV